MLKGCTIVITGAARGVGKAIAKVCSQAGARLILADVFEEEGQQTTRQIAATGVDCRFNHTDIGNPDSIVAFAADVQRNGSIDGLVNNAAIATNVGGMAFEDIDIDLWDRVMRVNVRGTWLVTSASSPFFNKGAQIVNLTSLYGDLHDFWRTSPSKVPSSR